MHFARSAFCDFVWFLGKTSIILSNSINPFVLVTDTVYVLFDGKVFVIGT